MFRVPWLTLREAPSLRTTFRILLKKNINISENTLTLFICLFVLYNTMNVCLTSYTRQSMTWSALNCKSLDVRGDFEHWNRSECPRRSTCLASDWSMVTIPGLWLVSTRPSLVLTWRGRKLSWTELSWHSLSHFWHFCSILDFPNHCHTKWGRGVCLVPSSGLSLVKSWI